MAKNKDLKPFAVEGPTDVNNRAQVLGFFERYLSIWVIVSIAVGIGIGKIFPLTIEFLGGFKWAEVNIPIAILIWLMIIPMLARIDLHQLKDIHRYWRGFTITLIINWLVKPFSMAFLGWAFIRHLFAAWLPAVEIDHYIAGLIILAAAPCTAMVFVWSYLCKGEPHFTLTQVTLNDLLMIVAFAPIVGLLLGITNISVPWNTLILSVLLYILIPFIISQAIRICTLKCFSPYRLKKILKFFQPISLTALLCMLVLLFSFQGESIINTPVIVLLLAIPIIIQIYFTSLLAYWLNKKTGERFCIAGPSALIGASNFFELAVATSIALFGIKSGAALATVVGVLVEVPVMLSVVKIVNRTARWYNR
jgi:ACR3 family arsenite transporter